MREADGRTDASDNDIAPKALRIDRSGTDPILVPLYTDRPYVFGRSPDCSFVFSSDSVSRRHGQLLWDSQNRWVYRDLNSSNGTYLLIKPPPPNTDPRYTASLLRRDADRAMRPGETLLLGDANSRLTFLEELPQSAGRNDAPRSSAARELEASIATCARHRLPVFLLGPSGSGKTFVARAIHDKSKSPGQFVRINCGALPNDATRLHSELLGHVKGAYTGATGANIGKFQAAENGTLFLDEVESLPTVAQDFLLDVLERAGGMFSPLGAEPSESAPPPNFRLISASKKPLSESGLRNDLCHRLVVGDIIQLPTLEERSKDIPQLVETFLAALWERHQIRAYFTEQAIRRLQQSTWPGQVRELESAVHAVATREFSRRIAEEPKASRVVIGLEELEGYLSAKAFAVGTRPILDQTVESRLPPVSASKRPKDLTAADIERALTQCGGNKTHASKLLGVAINTLKARMKALNIKGF